jgi:glycosyltransferase involved in cell wall biosynthesis
VPELHVRLDAPLPTEVATGSGTAIFVCGWCYSPAGPVRSLEFVLDGIAQPVMAFAMPRLDPYRELGEPLAYRSGFWGLVKIASVLEETELTLELCAVLSDRSRARTQIALIPVRPGVAGPGVTPTSAFAPTSTSAPAQIAIAMATYNPPADLLAVQLDSIRNQTHTDWICCISDDCSSPRTLAALEAAIEGDPRFRLSHSTRRLGFYRNFERALAMVPAGTEFVALADQDDRWYPHKLSVLAAQIGGARLIYSDARIVTRDGVPIADTYWGTRQNNHTDLLSLLVANSVTGAASLMRADLLADALPFPPAQFAHYHDHWLALVARCLGEIRYVAEPLYDYVQHGDASLGHAKANLMPTLKDRLAGLRTRGPRERIHKWRMHYFVDVARLLAFSTVLKLRLGDRMTPDSTRTLARFLAADQSPAQLTALIRRGIRELGGTPETLGAEWMLACALVWRRLLSLSTRDTPQRVLRLDALAPTELAPGTAQGAGAHSPTRRLADKIAPLDLRVDSGAPPRVNLLIPSIDVDHFFAGYIAKFNLALALARRGHRVRIVTVDPGRAPGRDWAARVEAYSGLAGFSDQVEVVLGREAGLTVSPEDRFIATTWWTAHIAHAAVTRIGADPFLYLIQEYEPFTFPMGSFAALAEDSYRLPHRALFSTALLQGYFRARGIGAYADAQPTRSASFDNAITAVPPPTAARLQGRRPRRLLFYARPEAHAARNLFELGVLALERAAAEGCFDGWELTGIGSVGDNTMLGLGGGVTLNVSRRSGQSDYAELLAEHDVGLALMYTPHPSLVPLEMASAGMLTVTNTFENKTAAALTGISANLIAAEPSVASVAAALLRATATVDDVSARVAGSGFAWPRSWGESLNASVMAYVEEALSLGSTRLQGADTV